MISQPVVIIFNSKSNYLFAKNTRNFCVCVNHCLHFYRIFYRVILSALFYQWYFLLTIKRWTPRWSMSKRVRPARRCQQISRRKHPVWKYFPAGAPFRSILDFVFPIWRGLARIEKLFYDITIALNFTEQQLIERVEARRYARVVLIIDNTPA